MARSYGRIATSIWRDKDFRKLSSDARFTYLMLCTQPDITPAGVLRITDRRWCVDLGFDPDRLLAALDELSDTRYVVIDWDEQELLVRSFVKWDGGATNTPRRKIIAETAEAAASDEIRAVLAGELDRFGIPHTLTGGDPSGGGPGGPLAGPHIGPLAGPPDKAKDKARGSSCFKGELEAERPAEVVLAANSPYVTRARKRILAAYAAASNLERVPSADQARVNRSAQQLLLDGFGEEQITGAARNAAAGGWTDLVRQIQIDAARAHPGPERPSTTDQRVGAGVALANRLRMEELACEAAARHGLPGYDRRELR